MQRNEGRQPSESGNRYEHKATRASDLYITPVGLCTWAIGRGDNPYGWGRQDDNDSIAAIRRAFDLGVNWIDTAAGYGKGHSDIATKGGILWKEDGSDIYSSLKVDSIRREVEESLRRLVTDFIDRYQIHWPLPDDEIEDGWAAVTDLIKAGRYAMAASRISAWLNWRGRKRSIRSYRFSRPIAYWCAKPSLNCFRMLQATVSA